MSIVLDAVSKNFPGHGQPILADLSLEIESGQLFVLLGASGSGKSTLLRIIAGLTTLDSGRVLLHGRDVTDQPPQQRGIGFVFQNYSLFEPMTVAQNVGFALDLQRLSRAEKASRVAELLDLIEMRRFAERLPGALSGGQKQRVALARALAHQPNVLLLDEPFGALDVRIRGQLRQDLRAIQQRLGVTAILVTHDQDEAFELADQIGVIERGRLLEVGSAAELYHTPGHRYTASFLGTANVISTATVSQVQMLSATVAPLPANEAFLLRPEGLILAPTAERLRERAAYSLGGGTISAIAFAVPMVRVTVEWPGADGSTQRLIALVDAERLNDDGLCVGGPVWIGFDHGHGLPHAGE